MAEQSKLLKKGKGADDEGVVAEMLKYSGAEVEHEIAEIFNCVMRGIEEVPQYWKCAKITVIFKKGNDRLPNNYRPISITPILYRLFSRILLARIHKKLGDAQSKDPAGFRPEFGCVDHLFTATAIAEDSNSGLSKSL